MFTPTPSPTASPTRTLVAFPTLIPSSTPTPAPSPTATPDLAADLGPLLYREAFDEANGWPLTQTETGGDSLIEGRLVISVRTARTLRLLRSPAPEVTDFYLEVSVRAELCNPRDEYGVMVRLSPLGDHYRFGVTCDGAARIARVVEGSLRGLVPLTVTNSVLPGAPANNLLTIWARGSQLRFYINGLEAFRVRDDALARGGVGLFIRSGPSAQLTVSFDDLVIYPLLPEATPAPS